MSNEAPPSQSGPTGMRWQDCGICGLTWPVPDLVEQLGLLVCPGCTDDEGVVKKETV